MYFLSTDSTFTVEFIHFAMLNKFIIFANGVHDITPCDLSNFVAQQSDPDYIMAYVIG